MITIKSEKNLSVVCSEATSVNDTPSIRCTQELFDE